MTSIAGLVSEKMQAQQDVARRIGFDLLGPFPRGRDDRAAFVADACTMAVLNHRTLDFTPDGAQPYTAGAFTVALDGYIANAQTLRRDLEDAGKAVFRGHSDAELIARGACAWGLNRLLQKMEGAFAFALWDADNQVLHLVRDRLGLRPLYACTHEGTIAFSSDYRGFRALPGFTPVLDHKAMKAFLAWGHMAPPLAPWEGVISLPPGHRLMVAPDDNVLNRPEAYWTPGSAVEESILRGAGDGTRRDRLFAALSKEALRIDVSYGVLDDLSPASSQLRSNLDQVADKPYKAHPITLPDGIALQMAYDSLGFLPEPVSDPMAPSWFLTCQNAAKESPVCLAATVLENPPAEDPREQRLRRLLSSFTFLHPLLPARHRASLRSAEDGYLENIAFWNIPDAPLPPMTEPRIDSSPAYRQAFWGFADHFRHGFLPALDRIAHAAGTELRLPYADARLLDIGLPCSTGAGSPDIATWLRGPLRPRVGDQVTAINLQRLGIEDPSPYIGAWKNFLAGDNSRTRALWALGMLLGWAERH